MGILGVETLGPPPRHPSPHARLRVFVYVCHPSPSLTRYFPRRMLCFLA